MFLRTSVPLRTRQVHTTCVTARPAVSANRCAVALSRTSIMRAADSTFGRHSLHHSSPSDGPVQSVCALEPGEFILGRPVPVNTAMHQWRCRCPPASQEQWMTGAPQWRTPSLFWSGPDAAVRRSIAPQTPACKPEIATIRALQHHSSPPLCMDRGCFLLANPLRAPERPWAPARCRGMKSAGSDAAQCPANTDRLSADIPQTPREDMPRPPAMQVGMSTRLDIRARRVRHVLRSAIRMCWDPSGRRSRQTRFEDHTSAVL